MVFSVDLSFTGDKSLLNNVDFILTFDKQFMEGMYSIYNPVVWRCINSAFSTVLGYLPVNVSPESPVSQKEVRKQPQSFLFTTN